MLRQKTRVVACFVLFKVSMCGVEDSCWSLMVRALEVVGKQQRSSWLQSQHRRILSALRPGREPCRCVGGITMKGGEHRRWATTFGGRRGEWCVWSGVKGQGHVTCWIFFFTSGDFGSSWRDGRQKVKHKILKCGNDPLIFHDHLW